MRRLVIAASVLLALVALARAQIWIMSPANQAAGNRPSTPVIPCTQTGLNFTVSCNAILYVVLF